MSTKTKLPTYFLSHGGGPWSFMQGDFRKSFDILESSLVDIPRQLPHPPKAILVISGHWEEKNFKISSSPQPPMIYDYYGFPDYTYQAKYSAPGSPELAKRVQELLKTNAGINADLDSERGFDHGTYAPLVAMYPKADIPIVQLSMRSDYDPEIHLKVGNAISILREEGILILGSGSSYHNLSKFRGKKDSKVKEESKEFDDWLQETLGEKDKKKRKEKLIGWEKAPSARKAQPQEDHLIPLMVVVGAAEEEEMKCIYHEEEFFGGITISGWRFG